MQLPPFILRDQMPIQLSLNLIVSSRLILVMVDAGLLHEYYPIWRKTKEVTLCADWPAL